jgi:hypothetical protein
LNENKGKKQKQQYNNGIASSKKTLKLEIEKDIKGTHLITPDENNH